MSEPSRASDPDGQSRWKTIAWVIGPLAVVLALAFLVFQPTFDLSASSTSPTPSASLSATATPFPTSAWDPIDAASLAMHPIPFDATATVNDLAVAGTRLIAAGANDDAPAAWYSDDGGETWTTASVKTEEPPRSGAHVEMLSVAAYGSTLAALGQWHQSDEVPFAAAIWTSTDAGQHWSEAPEAEVPRNIYRLTSGGIGFLASAGDARLLVSTDGKFWDDLPSDPLLNSVYPSGFAASGRTVVIMAERLIDDAGAALTLPVFWEYTDGSDWSTVDRGGDRATLRTIIADAGGFYAGGMVYSDVNDATSSRAAMWRSPDGTSWQVRVLSESLGLEVDQLAHGGLGTLAIGGKAGHLPGRTWLVPNGDDPSVQEYEMDWEVLTAAGLGDRFVAFALCGLEAAGGCAGPQMLIIAASDEPYVPPSPR